MGKYVNHILVFLCAGLLSHFAFAEIVSVSSRTSRSINRLCRSSGRQTIQGIINCRLPSGRTRDQVVSDFQDLTTDLNQKFAREETRFVSAIGRDTLSAIAGTCRGVLNHTKGRNQFEVNTCWIREMAAREVSASARRAYSKAYQTMIDFDVTMRFCTAVHSNRNNVSVNSIQDTAKECNPSPVRSTQRTNDQSEEAKFGDPPAGGTNGQGTKGRGRGSKPVVTSSMPYHNAHLAFSTGRTKGRVLTWLDNEVSRCCGSNYLEDGNNDRVPDRRRCQPSGNPQCLQSVMRKNENIAQTAWRDLFREFPRAARNVLERKLQNDSRCRGSQVKILRCIKRFISKPTDGATEEEKAEIEAYFSKALARSKFNVVVRSLVQGNSLLQGLCATTKRGRSTWNGRRPRNMPQECNTQYNLADIDSVPTPRHTAGLRESSHFRNKALCKKFPEHDGCACYRNPSGEACLSSERNEYLIREGCHIEDFRNEADQARACVSLIQNSSTNTTLKTETLPLLQNLLNAGLGEDAYIELHRREAVLSMSESFCRVSGEPVSEIPDSCDRYKTGIEEIACDPEDERKTNLTSSTSDTMVSQNKLAARRIRGIQDRLQEIDRRTGEINPNDNAAESVAKAIGGPLAVLDTSRFTAEGRREYVALEEESNALKTILFQMAEQYPLLFAGNDPENDIHQHWPIIEQLNSAADDLEARAHLNTARMQARENMTSALNRFCLPATHEDAIPNYEILRMPNIRKTVYKNYPFMSIMRDCMLGRYYQPTSILDTMIVEFGCFVSMFTPLAVATAGPCAAYTIAKNIDNYSQRADELGFKANCVSTCGAQELQDAYQAYQSALTDLYLLPLDALDVLEVAPLLKAMRQMSPQQIQRASANIKDMRSGLKEGRYNAADVRSSVLGLGEPRGLTSMARLREARVNELFTSSYPRLSNLRGNGRMEAVLFRFEDRIKDLPNSQKRRMRRRLSDRLGGCQ